MITVVEVPEALAHVRATETPLLSHPTAARREALAQALLALGNAEDELEARSGSPGRIE